MENISALIADRMCKLEIIKEDDLKYYAYSIQVLLERTIGFILISIFALAFRSFFEIAVFVTTFILIRIHSDGIHCRTSVGCFVSSVLFTLSTIPVTTLLINHPIICKEAVMFSMVLIFVIGTIRDPNLNLSDDEFFRLKIRSRIGILIIGPIALGLLMIFPENHFVYYSACGVIYNALSLMAVKILQREVSGNEKEVGENCP